MSSSSQDELSVYGFARERISRLGYELTNAEVELKRYRSAHYSLVPQYIPCVHHVCNDRPVWAKSPDKQEIIDLLQKVQITPELDELKKKFGIPTS